MVSLACTLWWGIIINLCMISCFILSLPPMMEWNKVKVWERPEKARVELRYWARYKLGPSTHICKYFLHPCWCIYMESEMWNPPWSLNISMHTLLALDVSPNLSQSRITNASPNFFCFYFFYLLLTTFTLPGFSFVEWSSLLHSFATVIPIPHLLFIYFNYPRYLTTLYNLGSRYKGRKFQYEACHTKFDYDNQNFRNDEGNTI